MTTCIAAPLLALLTALSLLPLEGCALQPSQAAGTAEISVSAEYGEPLPVGEAVADDWFSDTAFIGHSLIQGFAGYGGLSTADYYYLSGASVETLLYSSEVTTPGGTGRLADALAGREYERVYLMMGINEIAGDPAVLKADYLELIDLVRENNPDAALYVISVLPVTEKKDAGGDFTIDRITRYNDMLMELCAEEECWYVDLYSCFADEGGFLPSSASTDGIHLKQEQYLVMLDYLRTHTAD